MVAKLYANGKYNIQSRKYQKVGLKKLNSTENEQIY
jgi:hypothetical protein